MERQKIVLSNLAKLSYENYKSFLGELANHLVTNFYNQVYSLTYTELIEFTDEYREHNLRFVIDTKEIVDHIILKGIMVKHTNKRYSFRLRGVFEFFIAYNMIDNIEFRESVINDDKFYLSFGNELELYSGFVKKDKDFLLRIFTKSKKFINDINNRYKVNGSHDYILLEKLSSIFDISGAINQLQKSNKIPLKPQEQDKLMEQLNPISKKKSEVIKKEMYDEIKIDPVIYEKFILILSRIFRNTDQIKDEKLILKIFDFILDSYCYFGYYLIDEASLAAKNKNNSDDDIFLKLMTNFIPIIIQVSLFNAIGQNNLERIILDKIRILEQDDNENQYLLFLLYTLLIDLDVEKNIVYVDDLLKNINLNILKS
ncbi:MAG: hypothetical protein GY932_05880, partial [Arcobacter sp.]|nr:hypothetical protein [Arcobacter sp.]